EFDDFYVTQVYTPNAGDGLKRLADRQIWDVQYAKYLSQLDSQKPVLATGDYNVAHKEIDLANPASNRQSPGFTDEERQGFTNLLAKGFTDTFRHLHGDVLNAYTWWAQRSRTSK
ncbi:exodeoxyribonuclease III, partial [Streptococcus suis]